MPEGKYGSVGVLEGLHISADIIHSLLDRRNSSPGWTKLEARKPTVKLSIYEGSGKYVLLQITSGNAGTTVRKMLMGAIQYVENFEIRFNRDDLLRGGHFEWNLPPVNSLNVWDANNHQATYDIVGLTITTIYNYMSENGFGSATFLIFDGKNQVGAGKIK